MISRRSLFLGLSTIAATLGTSSANAGSILDIFAIPEPDTTIISPRRQLGAEKSARSLTNTKRSIAKVKVQSKGNVASVKRAKKSKRSFKIDSRFEPQDVAFNQSYATGTIVVNSNQRFLYLVTGPSTARRYGVAIGKQGLGWKGNATIKVKAEWPSWTPTPDMIARSPKQYARFKDGMPGGPTNPLGARALYLYQGKRDTSIRIHGTTAPWSIGQAASNGCFRMVNEHVIDLYSRVRTGTRVVVL